MLRRAATRQSEFSFGLLATLTLMVALTPYSVDAFLPAAPDAATALGASAGVIQLSLSALLVGIAVGQLVFGPVSDVLGRRGPLLVGAGVCAAAAVASALAPTVEALVAFRLVQGLAGSAAMVIGKTIIRDRTEGPRTTHVLAMTAVAAGGLNILAPVVGGLLAGAVGWRGPLWFIAAMSLLLFVVAIAVVPETHPAERREPRARALGLFAFGAHLRNRPFLAYVAVQAGSYGALMAYVASSPFVYQRVLGFDATTYGVLFAVNAASAVAANFVGNRFLRHLGSRRLVLGGLVLSATGAALVGATWALGAPPVIVAVCITLSMAPLGLNAPNLVGLALNEVSRGTGSAAATIGFVQFLTGALVAPLVALGGTASPLPGVVAMMALALTAASVLTIAHRRARRPRGANGEG
jgi:MFS transporter, DHA1 family, multidrug resistance protein